MFKVQGSYGEIPYLVEVDTTQPEDPVAGSQRIEDLLTGRVGETVAVTPTGPYLDLDLEDEGAVLAALAAWTTITAVSGGVPRIIPPEVEGAVY